MTFGSLFSGVGGFDLGLERANMQPVWQVEIDKDCNKVLARHWPGVERHTDVKAFTRRSTAIVPDLIAGGFPCTDVSLAGRRAGLAGDSSGLWDEFARIVGDFSPEWVLIENVPGLFSSSDRRDFLAIIKTLADMGYGVGWRVLDAQWFGLAQRRKRVFIVGCLGNFRRAAAVLFESESLPWDSPPGREAGEKVAYAIAAGVGSRFGSGRDSQDTFVTDRDVAKCLNAGRDGYNDGSDQTYVTPIDMRQASRGAKMTNNRREGTSGGAPGTGIGEVGDPAPTVASSHTPAVCFQTRIGRNGRGQPKDTADALASCAGGTHVDSKPHVAYSGGVRRLMPVECCRLQGFPDDWLDGLSDSAKYRCLGNAVAVPVAHWIGKRIMATAG